MLSPDPQTSSSFFLNSQSHSVTEDIKQDVSRCLVTFRTNCPTQRPRRESGVKTSLRKGLCMLAWTCCKERATWLVSCPNQSCLGQHETKVQVYVNCQGPTRHCRTFKRPLGSSQCVNLHLKQWEKTMLDCSVSSCLSTVTWWRGFCKARGSSGSAFEELYLWS